MIILASKSPRRKELLERANIKFKIITENTSEIFNKDVSIKDALIDVAYQKALPVFNKNQEDTIISADTIVVVDDIILGKPKDYNEAFHMLSLLSNRYHYVMTAVIIKNKKIEIKFVEETKVYFKEITKKEIDEYILKENVYDKAGGYAIQEGASKFVTRIEGDYDNVVGLPITRVIEELKKVE